MNVQYDVEPTVNPKKNISIRPTCGELCGEPPAK